MNNDNNRLATSIISALIAGLSALSAAFASGGVGYESIIVAVVAALTAFGAVKAVPQSTPEMPLQPAQSNAELLTALTRGNPTRDDIQLIVNSARDEILRGQGTLLMALSDAGLVQPEASDGGPEPVADSGHFDDNLSVEPLNPKHPAA